MLSYYIRTVAGVVDHTSHPAKTRGYLKQVASRLVRNSFAVFVPQFVFVWENVHVFVICVCSMFIICVDWCMYFLVYFFGMSKLEAVTREVIAMSNLQDLQALLLAS